MSTGFAKLFENISGWSEIDRFEAEEEGHVTQERMGDAMCMFLWRVDMDPVPLDNTFIGGHTFVRYRDNAHY